MRCRGVQHKADGPLRQEIRCTWLTHVTVRISQANSAAYGSKYRQSFSVIAKNLVHLALAVRMYARSRNCSKFRILWAVKITGNLVAAGTVASIVRSATPCHRN